MKISLGQKASKRKIVLINRIIICLIVYTKLTFAAKTYFFRHNNSAKNIYLGKAKELKTKLLDLDQQRFLDHFDTDFIMHKIKELGYKKLFNDNLEYGAFLYEIKRGVQKAAPVLCEFLHNYKKVEPIYIIIEKNSYKIGYTLLSAELGFNVVEISFSKISKDFLINDWFLFSNGISLGRYFYMICNLQEVAFKATKKIKTKKIGLLLSAIIQDIIKRDKISFMKKYRSFGTYLKKNKLFVLQRIAFDRSNFQSFLFNFLSFEFKKTNKLDDLKNYYRTSNFRELCDDITQWYGPSSIYSIFLFDYYYLTKQYKNYLLGVRYLKNKLGRNFAILYLEARVLFNLKKYNKSLELAEEIIKLEPDFINGYLMALQNSIFTGDYMSAVDYLKILRSKFMIVFNDNDFRRSDIYNRFVQSKEFEAYKKQGF